MKHTLQIAPGLALPLETVTQAIGILAKRRAGKSYTARRLAEQLLECGQQVVIVDPKGDTWGIRSSADGKGPGFPVVIIGGERGDVKLEPGSGEIVAKLVVEERVSVLLDLSLLRKHEVATFMTAFLENLYRLKAREQYRTPVMLLIDEADAIAPQKPQKGEERMLGAAEDIVRRGGQRGIGCTLVSQRSAVLNKNVLTQVQVLIVLRTIAPQDLAALDAWIDVHGTEHQRKTLRESLPSLPIGDAWFWSPGWPDADGIFKRVHVLPIDTFDSGATPKPGEKRIEPRSLADVDLEALKRQMADTIERSKAEDPKELRKQIAELRKELAAKPEWKPDPLAIPTLKREFDRGADSVKRELGKQLRAYAKATANIILQGHAGLVKASKAIEEVSTAFVTLPESPELDSIIAAAKDEPRLSQAGSNPASVVAQRDAAGSRTGGLKVPSATIHSNGNLRPVEQKILDAIAEMEAIGVGKPPRVQVALMADYTNLASKGFVNSMSSLRTAGYIDYPNSDSVAFTSEGRKHANPVESPRSLRELHQKIIDTLGGAHGKILRVLIDVYPDEIDRATLGEKCGYTNLASKGFVNSVSKLRTLGFLDYPSTKTAIATPMLFPKGLN